MECHCGSRTALCIECDEACLIGTRATCKTCGKPVACRGCGLVVADDLSGVITLELAVLPFVRTEQ